MKADIFNKSLAAASSIHKVVYTLSSHCIVLVYLLYQENSKTQNPPFFVVPHLAPLLLVLFKIYLVSESYINFQRYLLYISFHMQLNLHNS